MFKLMFCLRRRPDLSVDAFHAYWRERHAPLVREVGPLLGIRRYVQSHAFDDPRIVASIIARGGGVARFDGVAELSWDSIEAVLALGASKEARAAGRQLLDDERQFIDLANSPLFWVREVVVI